MCYFTQKSKCRVIFVNISDRFSINKFIKPQSNSETRNCKKIKACCWMSFLCQHCVKVCWNLEVFVLKALCHEV